MPGKTLHRLNQAEYDSTVRDLLATTMVPSTLLPPDEVTHSFDNMADALTTSSFHLTGYEVATDQMLAEVWGGDAEESVSYPVVYADDPTAVVEGRGEVVDGSYEIIEGSFTGITAVVADGLFEVRGSVYAVQNGFDLPELELEINGAVVGTWVVAASAGSPEQIIHQLELQAGVHTFTWRLLNPAAEGSPSRHRLGMQSFQVEGPVDSVVTPGEAYGRLVTCDPVEVGDDLCAEEILGGFLMQAWRRPPTAADLDWALSVYQLGLDFGEPWDGAVRAAMKAVLLHPAFIYRVEVDPTDGMLRRRLDGYELATRLSYFLWSSMPDDTLFAAAEAGEFDQDDLVAAHAARMIGYPEADALIDNLAGQWWNIRDLEDHTPLAEAYPDWDDELRTSMEAELAFLADDFFRGRVDLFSILRRQESWIDLRLAEHYGTQMPRGDWSLVPLPDGRLGLMGTAGWLTATSNTDRPSAVSRGKWVLENLLCSSPPPPPPDVDDTFDPVETSGSVREQEEALRADDYCQGCHASMDPIGFVLGTFDGTGATRIEDELGYPVDTHVELAGVSMSNLDALTVFVVDDPKFPACVAEKAFTYAMGRAPTAEDQPDLEQITTRFLEGGATFPALAEAVATSDAFLYRSIPLEAQ